jgi:HAE1 family hydrophobic/amphiphilic exporter-1
MNISAPFVRRPVAVVLCSLGLLIGGLLAYRALPIAALPRVDFPVIVISAQLAGASPETMANSVAAPLVREFSTVPAIQNITAANTEGSTAITLEFALSRGIDHAAADVQAAIGRAQRELPHDMTTLPSYRKFNPADAPVLLLALKTRTRPISTVDALARRVIVPGLSSIDGVGQVVLHGSRKFAVRIQLDPDALTARSIALNEVEQAIRAANANTPVGIIRREQRSIIRADTQFADAAGFRDLVIASRSGRPVRLGDVARVIDSVEDDQSGSWHDSVSALVVAVQRQPDANTVEVVRRVRAYLPLFAAELGPDTTIETVNDQSVSAREGIRDVQLTLVLTSVLVVLVIFLFTGRVRATLVLSLALPLSIVGTFAAMYMLGFSLNTISLLALTLAVGLVVDDAIVMQDSIQHRAEQGLPPAEAATQGAGEIGFTIVSITTSLVAAFIPILLMGGLIGRIFNEFAVTLSVALAISALVSLTLTPALAGRMPARSLSPRRWALGASAALCDWYRAALDVALRFRFVVLILFLGTLVGTVWLAKIAPKGFFPQEDLGQLTISTEARQDISFEAMVELQGRVERVVLSSPHVAHVVSSLGGGAASGAANQGRLFVELKPKQQRAALNVVLQDIRQALAVEPGIASIVTPVQNMRGGRQSRSQYQLAIQGTDFGEIAGWATHLASVMRRDAAFVGVTTDLQDTAPQTTIRVDRDKASLLGIGSDQLRSALYAGFGPRQVATIHGFADTYQVLIEFDRLSAASDALEGVRIRGAAGTLVPLSAIATIERTAGRSAINLIGQLPAVTISFDLASGVPLGEAVKRVAMIEERENVPSTVRATFTGTARAFQDSMSSQGWLLLAALVAVYIVLGILYESFVHPLTIMAGLPSAALGGLVALHLAGMELSAMAVLGLLLLIGIVKKNAIMLVDVALIRLREGATPIEAIREGCLRRFRPIMMTTFVAIAGAAPIAFGFGASSEIRQPLGVAILGGLAVSQVLTLFITPVLFLTFEGFSRTFTKLGQGTVRSTITN